MPETTTRTVSAREQPVIDRAMAFEAALAPGEALRTRSGRGIILSAPHAVAHPRQGARKAAECYSGALVWEVAEAEDVCALVNQGLNEDPNIDEGAYKAALRDLARSSRAQVLLDIHGAAMDRDFEVAIGTGHGRTVGAAVSADPTGRRSPAGAPLVDITVRAFWEVGFSAVLLDIAHFDAAPATRVSRFAASELGLRAIQIELRRDLRDPLRRPTNYLATARALRRIVQECAARYLS